jgi:hypothetical protein
VTTLKTPVETSENTKDIRCGFCLRFIYLLVGIATISTSNSIKIMTKPYSVTASEFYTN